MCSGSRFGSQLQIYYVIAFWAFVAAVLMYAFLRTPVGRMCNAVRDNPERAEFIGYDPVRVRLVVFAVAAMFAGLAGGLHALNYEIVAAEAGRRGALGHGAADGLHRRRRELSSARSSARSRSPGCR